jgi:hypothetical protein
MYMAAFFHSPGLDFHLDMFENCVGLIFFDSALHDQFCWNMTQKSLLIDLLYTIITLWLHGFWVSPS